MGISRLDSKKPDDDDVIKISAYVPRKIYRQFRMKLLSQNDRDNVSLWINQQVINFLKQP